MIRYFNKAIGPYLSFDKKSYLYFGGTGYLSLQTHYRFKRWLLKGVLKYGAHHGASRQSNIRISLFEKVEKVLADYRKNASIPGFRKGAVPMSLIQKQYGKAVLLEEVNKVLQENLNNYLVEEKLDILGNPLPKVTEDFDWNKEDFTFEFESANYSWPNRPSVGHIGHIG